MDWFRSHHGAPSDPKWLVVARKAKVSPALVISTFWMLLDYASQHQDRGSVQGFDIEVAAAFMGVEDEEVQAILTALSERGVIADGRLSNWDKRQPKREDDSKERVQRYRNAKKQEETQPEASVTQRNADVTQRNDREKEREKEREIIPLTPVEQEAQTTTTTGKAFAENDPLPLHVQNFLQESCPDWWEAHLRLALAGRAFPNHVALSSYAIEILRGWKKGEKAPQAPIPKMQAPEAVPSIPSLHDLRARRARALAEPIGGADATA